VASGHFGSPKQTIRAGIAAAVQERRRDVYVATGVSQEAIELVVGVGVYGGYSSDFRVRNRLLYEVAILGLAPQPGLPGAVNVIGLQGGEAGTAMLDGFTVFGCTTPPPRRVQLCYLHTM